MIQLQYYNSGLKNNHINKILNNYRIKYTQIKNEIESKVNRMMKFFLKDILVFLENIEEVAEQKRKISDYEVIQKELELTRIKIKNNIYNEHKLKNECDILQQENCLLKLKIKSLNQKIYNLSNTNNYTSQKTSPSRKKINDQTSNKSNNSKSKNDFMSPRFENARNYNLFTSVVEETSSHNKSTRSFFGTSNDLNNSVRLRKNIDKLTLKLNYDKFVKAKNNFKKKKKSVNLHKSTNNKVIKNINLVKDKNNSLKKFYNKKEENYLTKSGPICRLINKEKKTNPIIENKNINNNNPNNANKYSPINTINQSIELPFNYNNLNIDFQALEKKINNVIDLELKELEQDEANIEFLLENLNSYNDHNNN